MQIRHSEAIEQHSLLSHPGHKPPIFYVVDWLPPDFGAVGQYALMHAQQKAAEGRQVHLIGLTHCKPSSEIARFTNCGLLTIQRLKAKSYEKTRLFQRLIWTFSTNIRLLWAVFRQSNSRGAEILFTGAPPFMLYFAITLKYLRSARLTYRITDFYPEAIIAHWGRRSPLLALVERFTWFLRKKVDLFEVLGEDQRALLLRGGIPQERIAIKRDTAPITVTGREMPAPRPSVLRERKVLLYSGNYGVAHEVDTVAQGLARHHQVGTGQFGLWLNATGQNADILARNSARAKCSLRALCARRSQGFSRPPSCRGRPSYHIAIRVCRHRVSLENLCLHFLRAADYFCWPEELGCSSAMHPSETALHPHYARRCGGFCASLGRAERKLNFPGDDDNCGTSTHQRPSVGMNYRRSVI